MPTSSSLPVVGQAVPYRRNGRAGLRDVRRVAQVFFLVLWVLLFLWTRHPAMEVIPPDLFLITDPLVAALTMGTTWVVVPVMAFSLVLVVFTLVFGRAFCGWICPLGTLIDAAQKVFRPPEDRYSPETHARMQRWKYWVLVFMVFGAFLSAQWAYLLDPLVLMFRAFAAGIYPVLGIVLPKSWMPEGTEVTYHGLAFAPVALFVGVLALTALAPRFYCRYLCPLGAFYGLLSKRPLLRRRVSGCDACTGIASPTKQCITGCRMGAVPSNPHITQNHECIRCFSGRSFCHTEAIAFDWTSLAANRRDEDLDLGRRTFLTVGAAGVAMAPLSALSAYHRGEPNDIVRPPRVLSEEVFVDACIRCAMCVQACPTHTLQLTFLEAGVAGFWTPALTESVGGCIAECDACSVACPTDAIPEFGKPETDKWATKMGTAVLEKNRCISYTENLKCGECIDKCPTKAFTVEPKHDGIPRRPIAVDYFRCVGCGLCEIACRNIVFGTPALLNFAHGRGEPTSLFENPTETYEVPTFIPGSGREHP